MSSDNKTEFRYTAFETSLGWVGALASNLGMVRTTLPAPGFELAFNYLGYEATSAVFAPETFSDFPKRMAAFFKGKKVYFDEPIDLLDATPFQRKVWAATKLIPCGETRTYAWIANAIERPNAARAVGHALGQNPLPIIVPCHRVIGSNGGLCGFGGGLEMKKRLLDLKENNF